MLKIIVNRKDDTQILHITKEMYENGFHAKDNKDGITIKFFRRNKEDFDGTFIHTSNISHSDVVDFILKMWKYVDENRVVVFKDKTIEVLGEWDAKEKDKKILDYFRSHCPFVYDWTYQK